jgi:hypothetical protein
LKSNLTPLKDGWRSLRSPVSARYSTSPASPGLSQVAFGFAIRFVKGCFFVTSFSARFRKSISDAAEKPCSTFRRRANGLPRAREIIAVKLSALVRDSSQCFESLKDCNYYVQWPQFRSGGGGMKGRISALFFATVVAALLPSVGQAQSFSFDKHSKPDPATAPFDDACSRFAVARVAGYHDQDEQEWIAKCASHPDQETCRATKLHIEDAIHNSVPELVCGAPTRADRSRPAANPKPASKTRETPTLSGPSSDAPPDPLKARFDDACAMFAAARVAGYRDLNEQRWIANCSRHPERETCYATKQFIEEATRHPLPELACGKK